MKKLIEISLIVFVLLFGGFLYALSHQIAGLRAFIVSSGSMEPTIKTGSLVITQHIQPSHLNPNDIITFIAPTKEHEFVTHRIQSTEQAGNLTRLKTKGDHNKSTDNWTLAGGGVVGKVTLAIPYLGYFFLFSQSKVGIVLLILLPALYIIYSELGVVFRLIKRKDSAVLEDAKVPTIASFIALLTIFNVNHSLALLSDSVTLSRNQFTIHAIPSPSPSPTTTPTPTPSNDDCNINFSGNGAGSTTIVNCKSTDSTTVNQNTNTTVTNSTTVVSNTGGNRSSNNSTTSNITSGSTSTVVENTVITNSNNF